MTALNRPPKVEAKVETPSARAASPRSVSGYPSKQVAAEFATDFPTGINNTEEALKAVKSFENGQLMIEKNGVKYNAQGARLQ